MAAVEQPKKVTGGAFGRFLNAHRPALTKECEGKPVTAVTKLASERFKALGDGERAKYEEMYKQAQAQYEKDMEAFLAAGGEKKAIKRKGGDDDGKPQKDPNAPKKPAGGAYGQFLAKNRAEFAKQCEGKPVTAVAKLASEKWQALSEKDRQPFQAEYEAKFAAYQEAMKSYVPPQQDEAAEGTPEKKKQKTEKTSSPKAKAKGKAKTAKADEALPSLEPAVKAKADKAGLTAMVLKLASHQGVIDSGKSGTEILQALEKSGGLLHKAKAALLGA